MRSASFHDDLADLYLEAQNHFERILQPGSGMPHAATEIEVSPDGSKAAFTGAVLDRIGGPLQHRIFLLNLQTGRLQRIGSGVGLTPRFSPDGHFLAFRSDGERPGNFQVCVMDLRSSQIAVITALPGWVEYLQYSPDGRHMLVGVAGTGADLAGAQGGKTVRLAAASVPAWAPEVESRDDLFRRREIWLLETTKWQARRGTPAEMNVWEACWCGPNALAVVASKGSRESDWYRAELAFVDLTSGKSRTLHRPKDQIGCLSASAAGDRLAFVEGISSDRYLVAGDLSVVHPATGERQALSTREVDVTFTSWRGSRQLLLAGIRNLETVVADFNLDVGTFTERWASETSTCPGAFYPRAAAIHGSMDCLMGVVSHCTPMSIVRLEGDRQREILSFSNDGTHWLREKFGEISPYLWQASDGLGIGGWAMKSKLGNNAPLLLELHGGPISCWSPAFLGRMAYYAMLADRGFVLFWPNPRGSSGQGQSFARAVIGDMGGADAEDCLAGVEALIRAGAVDASRIAVMGGSYGGFLTAWLLTKSTRFAAAVCVSPVTNWVSQHLCSNIPFWTREYLKSQYQDVGGSYYRKSPILEAHRVRTPTLNICGALDRSTPPGQAREFHSALLEHGVESELITYPHEGHGIRGFPAIVDYSSRVVEWVTRHTQLR